VARLPAKGASSAQRLRPGTAGWQGARSAAEAGGSAEAGKAGETGSAAEAGGPAEASEASETGSADEVGRSPKWELHAPARTTFMSAMRAEPSRTSECSACLAAR
jgi:hypothetical protein